MNAIQAIAKHQSQTCSQSGYLGKCQVHKDDLAFNDVKPQIRVDARKDETGGKRQSHDVQEFTHKECPFVLF